MEAGLKWPTLEGFLASDVFQDSKNKIRGIVDCLKVAFGNVFYGMSHKNGFPTSSAYKLGLK